MPFNAKIPTLMPVSEIEKGGFFYFKWKIKRFICHLTPQRFSGTQWSECHSPLDFMYSSSPAPCALTGPVLPAEVWRVWRWLWLVCVQIGQVTKKPAKRVIVI